MDNGVDCPACRHCLPAPSNSGLVPHASACDRFSFSSHQRKMAHPKQPTLFRVGYRRSSIGKELDKITIIEGLMWREPEQRVACAAGGFGGRFHQCGGDVAKQTKTLWKIESPPLAKHDILRRYLRLSANIRHPRGEVVDCRGIASPGQDGIRLAD
jgi:hypothetical protein